jgi:dipeptidyl aminopeptidase/acylaminoacyl peptidase
MARIAVLVCAIVASTASLRAAQPVTFENLLSMRRVADAVMSPDGAWVLYTVRRWESSPREPARKEQRSQVWRVSTRGPSTSRGAGNDAHPLTFDEGGASAPAWSPDGRYISFLSRRGTGDERRPQVWLLRTDGGEAIKLTDVKDRDGVTSYAWSPDSTRIAYTTRDPESSEVEARAKRGDDRRVYEDEFLMSHLWTVEIGSQKATRVTEGFFTSRGEISWAPDGTRVTFAAAPTPMLRDDRTDVYIATLADKRVEKITANPGSDGSPRWSPDGNTIAFITDPGRVKPGPDGIGTQDPRQARLALYDVRARTIADVFDPKFDIEPRSLAWTPDSRRLMLTAGRGVHVDVFSYEPTAKRYAQLTSGRVIGLGTMSRDGSSLAVVMESASEPADVYASDISFATPRKLTAVNPQTADFSLGQTEVITWKNEGFDIEGVLLKPVGYTSGTKVPLLVVVHGGPAGAHLNNFRVAYGDGGQHWAGQGWAVLYPNPRGGTNYGEKFLRANIPDWGGGDYRDIMAGVDAVIARGIADPDRLAIQGWSYGGYMTSWAITQTTRFKAAMVGAGITNLWSMYGTNDLPNYLAAFFGGIPSRDTLPLYMERSAVTHAHKAVTPTLILHGGNDERVPIGQPMELYRALKERGTPVELVFYPRQGHGLQDYEHQLDRLRRQFDWITRHTLGGAARKTTTQ